VYGLIPFVDSVGLNCGCDWDWILGGGVVVSFLTQQFHVVVFRWERTHFVWCWSIEVERNNLLYPRSPILCIRGEAYDFSMND
jgi:hypothetical protein